MLSPKDVGEAIENDVDELPAEEKKIDASKLRLSDLCTIVKEKVEDVDEIISLSIPSVSDVSVKKVNIEEIHAQEDIEVRAVKSQVKVNAVKGMDKISITENVTNRVISNRIDKVHEKKSLDRN